MARKSFLRLLLLLILLAATNFGGYAYAFLARTVAGNPFFAHEAQTGSLWSDYATYVAGMVQGSFSGAAVYQEDFFLILGRAAVASAGSTRWRFAREGRRPTSGPIVGGDDTIYFTRVDRVQAVGPDGVERWLSPPIAGSTVETPPRLSPDGSLVFLGYSIFLAATGEAAALALPIRDELQFMLPTYATGADGGTYLLAGNTAIRWHIENGQAVADNVIAWDLGGLSIYLPTDAGIAANGYFWIFFGTNFGNSRLAWLDTESRALANIEVTQSRMRLIGIDAGNRAYMCATAGPVFCVALDIEAKGSVWELTAPEGANVAGGALGPGQLYVTTADGWLHAIGGSEP